MLRKLLLIALVLSVFAVGCNEKELTEVKGSKPEPSKEEQKMDQDKIKEFLDNPTFKDVKQEKNGPLVDIYELSTEAKYARITTYGGAYYDRANWSKTVKNGLDFALFSVVVADRVPRIDPETFEEQEGTTGEIGLNLAIRNRTNKGYEIGIRMITSTGEQYDQPTIWVDSAPDKNELFPYPLVSTDATARWDLMYRIDPKQLKGLEWIKLEFEVWSEDGTEIFKVKSGKIPLGEPTKFEQK